MKKVLMSCGVVMLVGCSMLKGIDWEQKAKDEIAKVMAQPDLVIPAGEETTTTSRTSLEQDKLLWDQRPTR
jgi:hypothetical protein